MKEPSLRLALFALSLVLADAAAPPADTKPPNQSERLKQRIDVLLKHRLKPEALPVILPNPFETVSGGATTRRPDDSGTDSSAEGDPDASAKSTGAKLAE